MADETCFLALGNLRNILVVDFESSGKFNSDKYLALCTCGGSYRGGDIQDRSHFEYDEKFDQHSSYNMRIVGNSDVPDYRDCYRRAISSTGFTGKRHVYSRVDGFDLDRTNQLFCVDFHFPKKTSRRGKGRS